MSTFPSLGESDRYRIAVGNEHSPFAVDEDWLIRVTRIVLESEGVVSAEISIAIVDDPTMHELNRRHLAHDYPTDVLSFLFERSRVEEEAHQHGARPQGGWILDGEVILSSDTALRECARYGWQAREELTLYLIHGLLHLCGYDDQSESDRKQMREREGVILKKCGLSSNYTGADGNVRPLHK